MTLLGILDEAKNVVPCTSIEEWGRWYEDAAQRIVQQTAFTGLFGQKVVISTVFLGIDHSFCGPPQWFETMVFINGLNERDTARYTTYAEAVVGHETMLQRWKWKVLYYPITELWESWVWWTSRQLWRAKRGWTALRTKSFFGSGAKRR